MVIIQFSFESETNILKICSLQNYEAVISVSQRFEKTLSYFMKCYIKKKFMIKMVHVHISV